MSDSPASAKDLAAQLCGWFSEVPRCLVALSGGVDSAVVAAAAFRSLGDRALAVTGRSPSLAAAELDAAVALARQVGIPHRIVETREVEQPAYRSNAPDRCFHCKTELYSQLEDLSQVWPGAVLVNGANLDDLGDYRPGMQAAREHLVRSPLIECGIGKPGVRQLAAHWELSVWDKPASPCLASRIAYGEEVTPERLARIEQAEAWLCSQGLRELRVRYHRDDLARIEVPLAALERLAAPETRSALVQQFKALGFKFITLDLEGFRSGSFGPLVPLAALTAAKPGS